MQQLAEHWSLNSWKLLVFGCYGVGETTKRRQEMDFFKSGLKSVLGSPEPGVQPSGGETVRIFPYGPLLLSKQS